jgi:hypothetical protein
MSVYTSVSITSTVSSYGLPGDSGRPSQNAINTAQVAALVQSYFAQGTPQSFAKALAGLPPAPIPRPPTSSASLPQAEAALSQLVDQVSGFAQPGTAGYQAFLGLQAMSISVSKYGATQGMYSQTTLKAAFVNEFPGASTTVGGASFTGTRSTKDEFGTGLGAGKGHSSNLSNSPEVVLALNSLLSKKGNIKMEELQKELKEKFGIESETTTINGRKALKFANGDHIVDANGNGGLDTGDYNFKGAVKAIKEKYGLSDEQVKSFGEQAQAQPQGLGQAALPYQLPQAGLASWYSTPYAFPQMQSISQLFAMAMYYAQ